MVSLLISAVLIYAARDFVVAGIVIVAQGLLLIFLRHLANTDPYILAVILRNRRLVGLATPNPNAEHDLFYRP